MFSLSSLPATDLPLNPMAGWCAKLSGQCRELTTPPSRQELAHAAARTFREDLANQLEAEDATDGIEATSRIFNALKDRIVSSQKLYPPKVSEGDKQFSVLKFSAF